MSNFEFGKEAAFEEMIEYADAGYGLEDLVDLATETINDDQVMNKIASEEDFDFQLGVEAFCHEFMAKTASLMAEYDTSELDEIEKIAFVLDKVAANLSESSFLTAEEADKQKKLVTRASKAGKNLAEKARGDSNWGHTINAQGYGSDGKKAKGGIFGSLYERAKASGDSGAKSAIEERQKELSGNRFLNKRNAGIAAATTGALATAAGARHLYKKRQARKAQEQGQQKAASEIDYAVAILQDAGLLD